MKDVMNVEAAELAVLIKISSGSIPKAATESFSVWRNKKTCDEKTCFGCSDAGLVLFVRFMREEEYQQLGMQV